jgi:type I restriction enzyme S subunit
MTATKAKAGVATLASDEVPMRPLGRCGRVLGGGTPSKSNAKFWNGTIPWVTAKEMWTGEIRDSQLKITEQAMKASPTKLIPADSVLFVVRGSILFKRVPVAVNRVVCTINQDMKAIVPDDDILGDYLALMMRANNDELKSRVGTAGNSAGKLETDEWSSVEIPIPPVAEQRRLVARVEGLTSRLEQARQARQTALAEAENVILSATQAAFASDATEGWDELPFAEATKRVQPRAGKLKTAEYHDNGALPIVDQGHEMICGYTDDLARKFQGPLPVIVFGDHTRNLKFVDFDFAVGADGTVLLHSCERIEPRFFYHWLRSVDLHNLGYSRHFKLFTETTVRFPVARAEQRRIATRLDALAAKQAELRRLQTETEAELAAFTPALLAKAFRGEL